jgi:thiol-disulfide isomerase/thioredoxin
MPMATSNSAAAPTASSRVLAVARSLGSTLLWTGAMVAVVLLVSGGPLKAGDPVDFSLTDVAGQRVNSDELRGKPTVLYFWATWCSACKLTTGTVEGFAARNPDTTVLAVTPENPALIVDWAKARSASGDASGLRWIAQGGPLLRKLGIAAFPTTVILDGDGKVLWNRSGVLMPGELDLRF